MRTPAPAVLPLRPRAAEEQRQRHLDRVLDVAVTSGSRFHRITQLATTIFGVAGATVVLAGPDHSDGEPFAQHTITQGEPVLIADATASPQFCGLASVAGPPYLRFFAGVPLADDEGVVVAAFCLYDSVPRWLDGAQWAALTELAAWARQELVDSEEMTRARAVAESLLPRTAPVVPGYQIAAVCQPAKAVGGDFYDLGTPPGRLSVSLVDVMGKGTGAALVAATVRALLRATMSEVALGLGGRAPEDAARPVRGGVAGVVADIDRLVTGDLDRTGTLVTGFFADLVLATGQVRYVDAGHGLAVVLRADGGAGWLRSGGLPLGIEPAGQWSDGETTLDPGDTLLCVSDGLLDLLGGTGEALAAIAALSRRHDGPDDLIRHIRRLAADGIPVDDVTAVAVGREDPA